MIIMKKYLFFSDGFTEAEENVICSGLDKFKKMAVDFIEGGNCDKATRKNGLSKIDMINSAKNRIANRIHDFPDSDLITMYCGLDMLNLKDDPNCDSAMKKLRVFFEAANIDIDEIINPPDDFPDGN